jgi:hypothetical protein
MVDDMHMRMRMHMPHAHAHATCHMRMHICMQHAHVHRLVHRLVHHTRAFAVAQLASMRASEPLGTPRDALSCFDGWASEN